MVAVTGEAVCRSGMMRTTYSSPMNRIVSLLPAASEIAAAFGLMDQVVGVSHECDFPSEANQRSRVTRCPVHEAALTSREVAQLIRRIRFSRDANARSRSNHYGVVFIAHDTSRIAPLTFSELFACPNRY